jgi:hypothetical protein
MWDFDAVRYAVMRVIDDLPLFWPAAVLVLALSAGLSGWVGRLLRTSPWLAFAWLASLGVIIAATLTPSVAAFIPVDRGPECVLTDFGPPALRELVYPNETSLNVALFVPLGAMCGLLRRWSSVAVTAMLAAALPFVIEAGQRIIGGLGRVCSTADVADNLTGLFIGLVGAVLVLRPLGSVRSIDTVARGPR